MELERGKPPLTGEFNDTTVLLCDTLGEIRGGETGEAGEKSGGLPLRGGETGEEGENGGGLPLRADDEDKRGLRGEGVTKGDSGTMALLGDGGTRIGLFMSASSVSSSRLA